MIPDDFTRVMSIDYGAKRIGIALSDPLKKFAYPHSTLNNDTKLFDNIEKIIIEKHVELILIGLPNDSNTSSTSIVAEIMKFKSELVKRFKINVLTWDETYTSVIASQKVIESVKSKRKRRDKGLVDMNSAAVILSEYLENLQT